MSLAEEVWAILQERNEGPIAGSYRVFLRHDVRHPGPITYYVPSCEIAVFRPQEADEVIVPGRPNITSVVARLGETAWSR